jgi:hypothetical protein
MAATTAPHMAATATVTEGYGRGEQLAGEGRDGGCRTEPMQGRMRTGHVWYLPRSHLKVMLIEP